MEVSGHLHAPAAQPPCKGLHFPLDTRLGGHQSRSEWDGEEKNSYCCPYRELNLSCPAPRSLITILTELERKVL
jgi:hypothetical protein